MPPSKSPSSDARASEKPDNEDTKPEDTALETTERASNTADDGTPSTVTDEEYDVMHNILTNIYAFRTEDGDDPSKLFHRKVNKRAIPDYYDVIKEPMAMSTIKAKINTKEYKSFEEFVRDWALICHNAQVYNSPNAQAYQDALTIRGAVLEELAKVAADGTIPKARTELPFLGEIPPADEMAIEEIEEDDDEEEDDEVSSEEEEEGKKKRKRGRPSLASKLREAKGESKDKEDDDPESRKKRGRPPRVDTPLEARIKAVMKGMRKPKNPTGELIIGHFERLPDKAMVPEYFAEIKNPIAMDQIKKKLKRKKYNSVDQFMRDVDIMFANAMSYNEDGSEIYEAAVELQQVARKLAEDEKKKPDAEFAMEDGRIPVPDGILHNGELWKVGDWVHIQNANDMSKPIVAQIYRTFEDPEGGQWVNACWYYRPEQTVHRFDKHFFENEVVKTGQYRDHRIDEIVDRCFVMFITRYNKGRPRGFPQDKEVYVCEARYNEEKHKINKIKTWASCLPDEVRDKDYEMDLYDVPRKLKKVPSPIKYLFKEDEQKVSDDLPKPIWGASNAPPKIGAVHCRPRDPKESPPPEPTPTPPPQPRPAPARQHTAPMNGFTSDRPANINVAAASTHQSLTQPTPTSLTTPMYHPSHHQTYHPNISPAPTPQPIQMRPSGYTGTPQMAGGYGGHLQQQQAQAQQSPMAHFTPMGPTAPNYNTHSLQQQLPAGALRGPLGPTGAVVGGSHSGMYRPPNSNEVFHLPDAANAAIPEDIRSQFQTDAQGRVLFFTTPPVPREEGRKRLAHTPKYLAWRAKQADAQKALKRKSEEREDGQTSAGADNMDGIIKMNGTNGFAAKRIKTEDEAGQDQSEELLKQFTDHMADLAVESWKSLYPEGSDRWRQDMLENLRRMGAVWEEHAKEKAEKQAKSEQAMDLNGEGKIVGLTGLMDYRPPNERLEWGRK